jgi:FimV-like protein
MILLIIKSYLTLLISVGIGSLVVFILGLYFIFKTSASHSIAMSPETVQEKSRDTGFPADRDTIAEPLRDLAAIAGDDVITTQLDLARAFIETGRNQSAKSILEFVLEQGNALQQKEAQQLMNHI